MTDAVHELSDAFNYAVAIFATALTARQASNRYSFGYHRAETIGALINVVCVCVLSVTLVSQAIERLVNPEPINGRCGSNQVTPWLHLMLTKCITFVSFSMTESIRVICAG
jgi:Co/Zn/Cd efflux system component